MWSGGLALLRVEGAKAAALVPVLQTLILMIGGFNFDQGCAFKYSTVIFVL